MKSTDRNIFFVIRIRLILPVLLSILTFNTLSAQSYFFRNYSVDEGLPFIQVSAIYQDSKGNLWTGGYGGLSKFNGSFTNYTPKNGLINHSVTCITEDKKGELWIGTINGVNKLDQEKFISYTKSDGLSDNNIRACITDRDGNIWFATENGITRQTSSGGLSGTVRESSGGLSETVRKSKSGIDSFTIFTTKEGLPSNDVHCIYQDSSGVIWFGTSAGLSAYADNKFRNYTIENGLPDNFINAIYGDHTGALWIGTKNGLSEFLNSTFVNYCATRGLPDFATRGLPDNEITALMRDVKGSVWVGTGKGLCKIISTPAGKQFKKYVPGPEFNSNIIKSLFSDYEGNLWVGTYNGIFRFRGELFALYAEKEGLKNTFIYSILRDKNHNLFVGTSGEGFYIYDGVKFKNYSVRDGLSGNRINAAVLDNKGDLWIGTDKGLSRFDGHSFLNFSKKDGLLGDSITAICIADNGIIWLGGKNGITLFDPKVKSGEAGKRFRQLPFQSPYGSFDVWSVFQDKNKTIWIGTYLGGLFRYKPEAGRDANGKDFTECSQRAGITSSSVFTIIQTAEGDLLFGTFDGVFLLSESQSGEMQHPKEVIQSPKAVHFSEADGMSSDLVYMILADDKGFLWAGTNQGINKINIREYKKTGKKYIQAFGKEEGFEGVECNTNGAFMDSNGDLWFGTVNGLINYSPKEDVYNALEPRTSITSVQPADLDTSLNDKCRLPYDLNNLTFNFIGNSLTNPLKVRYKYMLEGIDKYWSPVTGKNSVKYSNLPPGNFVFKVLSSNNEGVWNREPAIFSFTLIPPFWKTGWFMIGSTAGITALVFLFIYYRVSRVRLQEQQKSDLQKRIANVELLALRSQMNPHFIFNTMSSIQHYIANNEPDAALKYLSRFAKLMRAIMENTKQASILLKDELDTLKLYLELEAMRFSNKFEYIFRLDPKIDINYLEIPSMLIQPYIENAILHGLLPKTTPGRLLIDLTKNDNFILCTIEDDGVGRVRARELNKNRLSQHKSLGMSITKERLAILNHQNTDKNGLSEVVTDLYDANGNPSGTRVVISVPLEIT